MKQRLKFESKKIKNIKIKNLFLGLLVFAETSISSANNKVIIVNKEVNKTEVVNTVDLKIATYQKDDTCTITITRRVSLWDGNEATHTTSSATGTGATCEEAEANARKILNS